MNSDDEIPATEAVRNEAVLTSRLEVADEVLRSAPVELTFSLENQGDRPVHVLRWYTPLEGLFGDFLSVEHEGTPVPYQGPLASRFDPTLEEYLSLTPGEVASGTVNLALAYDLSRPGEYTVRFGGRLWDVVVDSAALPRPLDDHEPLEIDSAPRRFRVVDR